MTKLSRIPRRNIVRICKQSDNDLKKVHKWMIVWGMMSMLQYSTEEINDWMILNRFQRRYL